ncbi:MAG: chemoreceptor glutamine deamidase CheD [Pseudomonadales bacterium]
MNGRSAGSTSRPAVVPGFESVQRFWQPELHAYVAKILPGQYYVSRGGEWIVTVLGSCVSACIRDPQAGVGGMNHFMLPDFDARGGSGYGPDRADRYGSHAMEHVINDVMKLGAERARLEVKIVGGGRILQQGQDIGALNIEFVRRYLRREGLNACGEHVGGNSPRRVCYDVISGRVRVKQLPLQVAPLVANEELGYRRALEQETVTGNAELF